MDTGRGTFEEITEIDFKQKQTDNNDNGCFQVGQVVQCNGSTFRVQKIMKKRLLLKLLPRTDEEGL